MAVVVREFVHYDEIAHPAVKNEIVFILFLFGIPTEYTILLLISQDIFHSPG
jgi:hypothetical protein